MTRPDFHSAVSRLHWAIIAWTIVFTVPLVLLVNAFEEHIQSHGEFVRGHFGELAGGTVGGLMLVPLPMLAWLSVVLLLNRWLGIRCPH